MDWSLVAQALEMEALALTNPERHGDTSQRSRERDLASALMILASALRAGLPPRAERITSANIFEQLRDAFGSDSVPEKNVALRAAHDEIMRLQARLEDAAGPTDPPKLEQ